jgi:hypothetical protein
MNRSQPSDDDVVVTGERQTPIEIVGPENVHVLSGAVSGDLKIVDAEYVFTNTPPGGKASISGVGTRVDGSVEDGYIMPDGATGDVVVRDAEDVFIEHGGVGGALQIVESEETFHDNSGPVPPNRSRYDETTTGWRRSTTVQKPSTGVAVAGGRCSVDIQGVDKNIDVYVTGWKNEVQIGGVGSVSLHVAGSENNIETEPEVDLNVVTDTGVKNSLVDSSVTGSTTTGNPVQAHDAAETTERQERPLFGRAEVAYRNPAEGRRYCPNCGMEAESITKSQRKDAFFVFNVPVYSFSSGEPSYGCEECSRSTRT